MSMFSCHVLNIEKTEACSQTDCQYYGSNAVNNCIALVTINPTIKDIAFFKGIDEDTLKKERAACAKDVRAGITLLAYSRFCQVTPDYTSDLFESVKNRSPYSPESGDVWIGDETFKKMLSVEAWESFKQKNPNAKCIGYTQSQVLFLSKTELAALRSLK